MSITRRGFLVGSGGLITSSFVNNAQAFIERRSTPLLLTPPSIKETLFIHDCGTVFVPGLGSVDYIDPPQEAWTWARYFAFAAASPRKMEFDFAEWLDEPPTRDAPIPEIVFERMWSQDLGPIARAHKLLKCLDLGPELGASSRLCGSIEFGSEKYCGAPGQGPIVMIKDILSYVLLQARLIELNVPIKVELLGE